MALVFQSYALWPHMTVAQNIGYGLKLQKRSKDVIDARVNEMQNLLGLGGLGARKPAPRPRDPASTDLGSVPRRSIQPRSSPRL